MSAFTNANSKVNSRKRNANHYKDFNTDATHKTSSPDEVKKEKKTKQLNAFLIWSIVFSLYTVTFVFLHKVKYDKYPEPKYSNGHLHTDTFFENEARKHLLKLCSFGPKPAGSFANEIEAVQYITEQINAVKQSNINPKPINTLTMDVQNVSGAFLLEEFVRTSYYSVYENMQNVVALLETPHNSKSSLLINCHFDSVIDSPGAGDDIASCAVMLELLRALYVTNEPLKHNVIFLFNGAEENILQASHGFITKHPWASSVKAFINLDSAGAGGWEAVFQTGPEHPWLVRAYAESAIYPYGSIMGQELFQSGIIPSDTDFRIFRDFGKLPGLDIAYIANGYIYHTKNDNPEYIPPGSIQRAGENLLSVVKHICSNDNLEDAGADKHGIMVFYDVIGLFMVHYPSRIGAVFNSGLVAVVFLTLLLKYKIRVQRIIAYQDVSTDKALLQAIGLTLVCWVLVFALAAIVGVMISLFGQPMFWFTRTYNIILVFGVLSFTTMLGFHYLLKTHLYKYTPNWYVECLYYDAGLVLFSLMIGVLTFKDFASAFLPMLWVLFPFLSRYVVLPFIKYDNTRDPTVTFVIVTLIGQLIPVLSTLHSLESVFTLFIPIAGRAGGNSLPDLLIAVLTAFTIIICVQYLVGLVYICSDLRPLFGMLGVIFISSLLATQFTNLGFPYSGNVDCPTPQRALFYHIERNFYDLNGSKNRSDSGMWYLPFDQNGPRFLQDIPNIRDSKYLECEGNYCGVPYMYPLIHVVDSRLSLYTLKPPPVISNPVVVKLTDKILAKYSPRIIRYHFDVIGPDHMTIFITPLNGAEMTRWSITNDSNHLPTKLPAGVDGTTYFVYYSYGIKPDHPWHFFVDIKAPSGYKENTPLVDIAFNGHYVSGNDKSSPELDEFIHSLPDWVVAMSWISSYNSYLF